MQFCSFNGSNRSSFHLSNTINLQGLLFNIFIIALLYFIHRIMKTSICCRVRDKRIRIREGNNPEKHFSNPTPPRKANLLKNLYLSIKASMQPHPMGKILSRQITRDNFQNYVQKLTREGI